MREMLFFQGVLIFAVLLLVVAIPAIVIAPTHLSIIYAWNTSLEDTSPIDIYYRNGSYYMDYNGKPVPVEPREYKFWHGLMVFKINDVHVTQYCNSCQPLFKNHSIDRNMPILIVDSETHGTETAGLLVALPFIILLIYMIIKYYKMR